MYPEVTPWTHDQYQAAHPEEDILIREWSMHTSRGLAPYEVAQHLYLSGLFLAYRLADPGSTTQKRIRDAIRHYKNTHMLTVQPDDAGDLS